MERSIQIKLKRFWERDINSNFNEVRSVILNSLERVKNDKSD